MKITEILKICDKYASRLPKQAVADWESNHFELSGSVNGVHDPMWLSLAGEFEKEIETPCETERGKDMGAVLEILAIAPAMTTKLNEIVEMLPEINRMLDNLEELDLEAEHSEEIDSLFMKLHNWENT